MSTVALGLWLFAFWIAVSGSLAPATVALGALVAGITSIWARSVWDGTPPSLSIRRWGGLVLYLGYLLKSVVVAAVQVAEMVVSPHMGIDPRVITHRVRFERDISRVVYANSITLTPGTLAVDVVDDTFYIHCLDDRFAKDITSGELERRVARVFEE